MNTDVFDRVVGFIEANPEKHDQEHWVAPVNDGESACGTAACLAGWTVILENNLDLHSPFFQDMRYNTHYIKLPDDTYFDVSDEAQVLLGIDAEQANWLFHHENTIADIKAIGKDIANGDLEAASRKHDDINYHGVHAE